MKAYPDKLEKAIAVTMPYSVGIAVPKDKPEFRDAVMAALIAVQKAGIDTALLKKWELDAGNFEGTRAPAHELEANGRNTVRPLSQPAVPARGASASRWR